MYSCKRVFHLNDVKVTNELNGYPSDKGNWGLYRHFKELVHISISSILNQHKYLQSYSKSKSNYMKPNEIKAFVLKTVELKGINERYETSQALKNIIERIDFDVDLNPQNLYEYIYINDSAFSYMSLRAKRESCYFGLSTYNVIQAIVRQGTF